MIFEVEILDRPCAVLHEHVVQDEESQYWKWAWIKVPKKYYFTV